MDKISQLLAGTKGNDTLIETLYGSLETLCICFPARMSGSVVLERSLDYLYDYGRKTLPETFCRQEIAGNIPLWIRKDDSIESVERLVVDIIPDGNSWPEPYPLQRTYRVLANGLSLGTPENGLQAEICIVKNLEELEAFGSEGRFQGKLVLFDYESFTSYGQLAHYRRFGAFKAAAFGAVGVLIRSMTPNCSVSGVHTGSQDANCSIPAACMSIEDVEVLHRLAKRGHSLLGILTLPCYFLTEPKVSRNLIFEIPGTDLAHEIVIIGGHTDCWDCHNNGCQGAHDDGQGVIISLEIIRYLYLHNYHPRRTIRAVLFVDEEISQCGARAYQQQHAYEAENVQVAIETDLGVGPVCGFGFTGSTTARTLLQTLLQPIAQELEELSALQIREEWSGKGVDITPMIEEDSIPGMLIRHEDTWWTEDYFHFHHTNADTIDHIDKQLLLKNFQVLLGTVWILANCDERLPREEVKKKK